MKNTITAEQYRNFEQLAAEYNDSHVESGEFVYVDCYIYADEDGNKFAEVEAYDWDNNTDFGTLYTLLRGCGVEVDNDAETVTGTAQEGRKVRPLYGYKLPFIESKK